VVTYNAGLMSLESSTLSIASGIRRRHSELIVLLGALTAFAPVSIDMYLPALPTIGLAFKAAAGQVQLSLAAFFLGLAVGQAFYGPISDRFGRKQPLYAGLVLFAIASAGCALSTSIDMLIVLRFFQALGACSGQVIARAVVRDLFEPRESARVFSLLLLVMGVSPILAPLVGGQILQWFEWRVVFWVITALAVFGLAGVILRVPETHREENKRSLNLGKVLGVYYELVTDRTFIGYAVTGALAMAGLYTYIVATPFVFIELFHVPSNRFGIFFGINAIGLIAASQVNVRLIRRFDTDMIIRKVLVVEVATGFLLLAGTVAGVIGLPGTAVLLFVYIASVGCLFPNTTALAMAAHGNKAGSASALVGTLQFTLAAIAASAVGAANNGTALPMAAVIAACAAAAFLFYHSLVRPHRLKH
jgi:DHA1 family bicyclomycin/chloramphenicol resistance-like MFS transporter